jgi:crossover junction endodeoxyribonuclease RusA
MELKIWVPWPDKRLSPNWKRSHHWRSYSKPAKSARNIGFWACKEALGRNSMKDGPVRVKVSYYPPDRRRRDQDNMHGSVKHYLDGVSDALKIDDCNFTMSYVVHPYSDQHEAGVKIELSQDTKKPPAG